MDGGRVSRAMLTPRLGRLRATRLASRIGRVMAVLFAVYAVYGWPDRVLLLVIAVFIFLAAGAEYRRVRREELEKEELFRMWGVSSEPQGGDTVLVGPPPYGEGNSTEAEIHAD